MKFDPQLLARLVRPHGIVDVVLDTDAYNEIDDQFAVAYLLKAREKANVKALYAAPFFNSKSTDPKDGMEKSYLEILHILQLADYRDMEGNTYRGSTQYLPDEHTPVNSPAAHHLAQLAEKYTPEKPLYVLAIGAITNVASALLLNSAIKDRIVVVWLGGHSLHWPDTREFNMRQDVSAARVIFGSGVAVVQLPCFGVVDVLRTTAPELIHWLRGKNRLSDYLCENTIREAESYAEGKPWSRVIWDIATIAWLLDTEGKWLKEQIIPAPIPQYDFHYSLDPRRQPLCYIWSINRDNVFEDLFRRLAY